MPFKANMVLFSYNQLSGVKNTTTTTQIKIRASKINSFVSPFLLKPLFSVESFLVITSPIKIPIMTIANRK